jgi:adenylate cyclase
LIAAVAGFLITFFHTGSELRNRSYDYLFQFRNQIPPTDVVIVALDDASIRQLQVSEGRPLDRTLHARLLDRLTADGARLAVFDVLFDEEREPEGDEALERAIRTNGKVLLGASFTEGPRQPGLSQANMFMPIARFRTNALACGIVEVARESDDAVRQFHPLSWGAELRPLSAEAARLVSLGGTSESVRRNAVLYINHYGQGGRLPRVSFYKAVTPGELPAGYFRDKVVFIGGQRSADFSGATRESFSSPWTGDSGVFTAGVELHATMFLNLLHRDYFLLLPEWVEAATLLGVGLLVGFGLALLPPIAATFTAGVGMLALAVGGIFLSWQFHVVLPWMTFVAVQVPIAWVVSILLSLLSSVHEARTMERLLALHVPASRARQLLVRPELLKPNAEQMELTILFSDIANFSAVVQRKTPQDLVRLLSNYFESLIHSVHQSEGTVIKLIGDSVFAVWNAPEPQPKHREMACRSALLLREVLDEFDKKSHDLPLRTRIGLHTGPAFVGNFGSTERFDYTAIGDSVNLASRLEGLNEHLGTKILASRDTLMGLEGLVRSRLVGHFRLKGFDRVVEVHELLGINTEGSTDEEWQAQFGAGLRHYQRRELDRAEAAFRKTLELRESDGPSDFYLRQIALQRTQPPQAGWVGEVNMAQK